jgi:hypothetical protein
MSAVICPPCKVLKTKEWRDTTRLPLKILSLPAVRFRSLAATSRVIRTLGIYPVTAAFSRHVDYFRVIQAQSPR